MPVLRTRDIHAPSLDVTTDTPAAFPLHSPTPRQFQFPPTHALGSGSPSSSPSHSPFEADQPDFMFSDPFAPAAFAPVAIPTPPPFHAQGLNRRSPSPGPAPTHKRRKSSACSDGERRPKKGDDDYIKRPENAFILFRRKCCEERSAAQEERAAVAGPQKKQRQADLSKSISQQWKTLPPAEKQYWEGLAKAKKREHEQMYPNYVYRPQRSKDREGRAAKGKKTLAKRARADDEAGVAFVLPVAHPLGAGPARDPPPFQTLHVPHVAHVHRLAPASPSSLVPLIARQHSYASLDANNFDFLAPQSYVAPPPFVPREAPMDFFGTEFAAPKPGLSPLEQLALMHTAAPPDNGPSSASQNPYAPPRLALGTSPASSISSGSSGPPSPTAGGPFTPASAALDHSAFLALAASAGVDASSFDPSAFDPSVFDMGAFDQGGFDGAGMGGVSQAELDLQAEMQLQADFSQYAWGGWPGGAPPVLDNNWDPDAIPAALLGAPAFPAAGNAKPAYGDAPMKGAFDQPMGAGLDFGTDFAHALEGGAGAYDNPLLGGYDDLMSGGAFAAA